MTQLSTSHSALQINSRLLVEPDSFGCEHCGHENYVDPVCAMGALLSIAGDEDLADEAVYDLVIAPLLHTWNQRGGTKIQPTERPKK